MADINRISETRSRNLPTNRIRTVNVLDLTNGDESVSVVLKGKRTVIQNDDQAEARRLKQESEKSPWSEKRLGQSFANKSLKSRKTVDTKSTLKRFVEGL